MSMKRKILVVLLVIAMVTTLLTGCGGSGESVNKEDSISSAGQDSIVNEKDGTEEEEPSSADQDPAANEQDDTQDSKDNGIASYIVSGNEVTYEDEYITLNISEVQRGTVSTVNITASNKTEQRLGIYPEKWIINGFCVTPDIFGYMEIGPEEENVVNEVALPIDKLEALGISNIGEVVLQCELRDASENMLGNNVISSVLVGYQTTEYANADTEMDIALDEVGECEGVKLSAAIVPGGFYSWSDTSIVFVAENTGDKTVNIAMEDESGDVALHLMTGRLAKGETYILGLWGTDAVREGDTVKLYVTLTNATMEEVLVDGQEFEWIAK